jgi:ubiquinone/menaquinone biosynthesis C-methylase UbiE
MKKKPIYKRLAKYYDLIYSWKNYKREAEIIIRLIKQYKKIPGKDLLEMGCGTGKHSAYLKDSFSILAMDASKEMLASARKNIKGVSFKHGDMVNFELDKIFDVITCLFSSIGYVKTYERLTKTIENFSRHLKTGGVVIIEPWLTKSTYISGLTSMHTYSDNNIKIALLSVSKKQRNISIIDMNYLIAEKNKSVNHFIEHHELAMFEIDKMLKIMERCGLKSKFIKNGLMEERGLCLGVKR